MASIKPRTARVVIYQGDDLARLAELDAAVERATEAVKRAERDKRPRLMHEGSTVAAVQAELDAAQVARDEFADEAEPRGVCVKMHALRRRAWRDLMREHGPRDAEEQDRALGVNMDTLPDVLLPLSICRDGDCPICEEDPSTIEGDTEDFLESLSDYDYYDRLFLTAFALNRGGAMADPTLRLGSAPSPNSGATSN